MVRLNPPGPSSTLVQSLNPSCQHLNRAPPLATVDVKLLLITAQPINSLQPWQACYDGLGIERAELKPGAKKFLVRVKLEPTPMHIYILSIHVEISQNHTYDVLCPRAATHHESYSLSFIECTALGPVLLGKEQR